MARDVLKPSVVADLELAHGAGFAGGDVGCLGGVGFQVVEFLAVNEFVPLREDGRLAIFFGGVAAVPLEKDGTVAPGILGLGVGEKGKQAAAIQLGDGLCFRGFEQSGNDVDVRGEAVYPGAGRDDAGPTHEAGDPRASFVDTGFAAAHASVVALLLGAIVGEENDQRRVFEFLGFQVREEAADVIVDVLNHGVDFGGGVVEALGAMLLDPSFVDLERRMRSVGGDVAEEGLEARTIDKRCRFTEENVGAVALGFFPDAIAAEDGIEIGGGDAGEGFRRIAGLEDAAAIEDKAFVETLIDRAQGIVVAQVPFAEDAGAVAGGPEHFGQGAFCGAHHAAAIGGIDDASTVCVAAGKEAGAGGAANGRDMEARELGTALGEGIEMRRGNFGVAVEGKVAVALVVGHDQDDIGPASRGGKGNCAECAKSGSARQHEGIVSDNGSVKDEALLAHIVRMPHGKSNLKQLVREFGSKGVRREEVERSLERLTRKGQLIELRQHQFQAASKAKEFLAGTLRMHRDGFGFVTLDEKPEGLEGDVFVNPEAAQKAMHGDRVLVRMGRLDRDGKAHGDIIKVLHRANQRMVGEFRRTRRGHFVAPYDERIKQWIEIPEGLELPPKVLNPDRVGQKEIQIESAADLDRMMVTVEILEFPDEDQNGVGRIVEVLGHRDDFGVDVEIMIRKHHLPHEFPADVLEEAREVKREIGTREWEGRRDFRDYDIVTIDGETARDFDDAVWVHKLDNGNYQLHVHIADVSWYVRPGSAIDREAAMRGTSVYFPDRAVPMLPVELSTDICSLRPDEERLVSSVLLEIDRTGQTVSQEFTRGVIRSRERMTYTRVHELVEVTPEKAGRFALMKELALVLNQMRTKRGSIDFDLPEPLIEFDQFGAMTGVTRSPRNIAHRIIEEFMLAANEAVASELVERAKGGIYRIHETPDAKRVMEFEETASKFGHSLGLGAVPVKKFMNIQRTRDGRKLRKDVVISDTQAGVTSRHYQKLVAKIEGKPEERIVSYLMLRSLKQAKYSHKNEGHFALAAENYTHFTSPIRRYPDLVVHRLLHGDRYDEEQLAEIGEDTSFTERRAAEAERELVEWKKTKFMIDRVGDEFDAMIISTTKFGFFVELTELFIEGLVPIDTLPKDRYLYHENTRKLIGERTRRAYSIGDKVRVALVKVDVAEKRLTFVLPEEGKKKK